MKRATWEQAVIWLRAQPEQRELIEACYFDDPLLATAVRFGKGIEWQEVKALLPSLPGRALDLGAGRGISSYALAREGWRVTAVEPDNSEIVGACAIRQLAVESRLPIDVVRGYAESLSFGDEMFDVVHARQALHHSDDLWAALREIGRVLKHGGYLVATREHVISRKRDLDVFLANHPLHHLYEGENAYLLDEYLSAIKGSGLRIVKVFGTMQSPINYFPLTEEQRDDYCIKPLKKLFGEKPASRLTRRDHAFGKFLMNILLKYNDFSDKTPGRLYSFVARKP